MESKRIAKKKLGRGMDALLAHSNTTGSDKEIVFLPLSQIVANPDQPRKQFDPQHLEELAQSIKEHGILQPILVQPTEEGSYQIIAGERRYRAAKIAGLDEMPVISQTMSPETVGLISLIENLQREDLNPIEEAQAYRELLSGGVSQEALAQQLGIARTTIANSVRLLKLPETIQEAISAGPLSAGHARAILSVQDAKLHTPFFLSITQSGLSVRQAEQAAAELNSGKDLQDITFSADQKASPKQASKNAVLRDAELRRTEDKLMELFGTKVRIIGSPQKGKIEIHYFTGDDLEGLAQILLQ